MKIRRLIIVAAAFIITTVASPALAMYHPGMGRFMQLDPHGTTNVPVAARVATAGSVATGRFIPRDRHPDGHNLYQYIRSQATRHVDPTGRQAQTVAPDWNIDEFIGQPKDPNMWEDWLALEDFAKGLTTDLFPKRGTDRYSRAYREYFARLVQDMYAQYQHLYEGRDEGCCKLDPCTLTAQWMHESTWGASVLAQETYNLGSIKGSGPAGSFNIATGEHLDGQDVVVKDNFRDYHNLLEFMHDYTRLICTNERYEAARGRSGEAYYAALKAGGYATDPNYVEKMMVFYRQLGCDK